KYGITHKVATPYHPQTSGQVWIRILTTSKAYLAMEIKEEEIALHVYRLRYTRRSPVWCSTILTQGGSYGYRRRPTQQGLIDGLDPLKMLLSARPFQTDNQLLPPMTAPLLRQCVDDPDLHVGKPIDVRPPLAHLYHPSCPRHRAHSRFEPMAPIQAKTDDITTLSIFFFKPIRLSNLAEPICSVDGDNRQPPAPIRSIHQLTDVDLTLLSLIPSMSACIAFYRRPPALRPSSTIVDRSPATPSARCRPPFESTLPTRSIPSMSARSASARHDHSSATPTINVCIDDAAFATVPML
ncbi:hypothetical protein ACLOJK_037486, partial [Asimina triloba]